MMMIMMLMITLGKSYKRKEKQCGQVTCRSTKGKSNPRKEKLNYFGIGIEKCGYMVMGRWSKAVCLCLSCAFYSILFLLVTITATTYAPKCHSYSTTNLFTKFFRTNKAKVAKFSIPTKHSIINIKYIMNDQKTPPCQQSFSSPQTPL